ncbi:MAG: hypothetical protein MJ116_04880 [Lachnospiraceae bacterium]|nr:hypothetical protein [Lachnospiraceae bacterium]
MRVVIMENTTWNLHELTTSIHQLLPKAPVKGFTDGNAALAWCLDHTSDVDLFLGNWWEEDEETCGPEGANIATLVPWRKRPQVILYADKEVFRKWSIQDGANAFLLRPVTLPKLRETLEQMDILKSQ